MSRPKTIISPSYLNNKVFSRLRVLEFAHWYIKKNGNRLAMWRCQCECGKIKIVLGSSLTSNLTKSCGCLSKETSSKSGLKSADPDGAFGSLYNLYKRLAVKRKLEFNLTKGEFKKLTSDVCYYCNKEPSNLRKSVSKFNPESKGYLFNGVDRVNSKKGYTLDNCVTSCHTCNIMKFTLSQEDFIEHLKRIIKNMVDKKENNAKILKEE